MSIKELGDPWTFKAWLANFESVDLPIGDLARDVAGDEDFPDDDILIMLDHLTSRKKSAGERMALLDAWHFFKASTHPADDTTLLGALYQHGLEMGVFRSSDAV